jgi:hypothetical protein
MPLDNEEEDHGKRDDEPTTLASVHSRECNPKGTFGRGRTIRSSHTTTAPTGTSPASRARCAERRASSIHGSSALAMVRWKT